MEPGTNWHQLKDRHYKFHQFNSITGEMKQLDIYHSRVAVSRWGGPIAATKNTEHIILMKSEDIVKDCIAFFTNNGKLFTKVSYKDIERIVLFDFLEDEILLVLKQNGNYYLIDPFKGTKKLYDLGDTFRKNPIINAQVCGNGFVLMREVGGQIEYQYVANVYEPQMLKMRSPEISSVPQHWIVVPPNATFSRKVEVQITHPEAGIILLVEDEKKKIYYNRNFQENVVDQQLPHLPNLKMISVTPSYKFFSYLGYERDRWIMSVLSDDFEASTSFQIPLDLKEDETKAEGPVKDRSISERPQRMVWCGEDCVVLQLTYSLILVGPDASERIRQPSKNFVLFPEIDGLRLVSQKRNEILRRLPDHFINIFQTLSTQPGAMLYTAYEQFEQRNPIEDDGLRSRKNELKTAVEDCIYAGQFEIQPEYQQKLLKAASYGKTFLGNQVIDANILSDVCRNLRVQNAVKRQGQVGGRSLTYDQVCFLHKNEALFVKLLLRYNLHYLAHEISKHLKFQLKYRSQIYTHWACCKVESQEDDDKLCVMIKDKIKEEKGVSFTDIAHRAIEAGKPNLALKLLDNEPSLAKRVPVLLWMATYQKGAHSYYEKALEDALKSRDSNLIYLVIMKFLRGSNLDEQQTFQILSSNPITQAHLVTYLRSFDQLGLSKYFQYMKKYDECAFLTIQQAYQQDKLPERIKLLEFARRFFDDEQKDSFYGKIIAEQIEALNELRELAKDKNSKKTQEPQEKPLNDLLEIFFRKDDLKTAQDFAKHYKIPERRFHLTRAKTLILNKNFDELDRLMTEKNKKQVILPYEMVADLLMRNGEEERGLRMLLKMTDVEESVNLFMKIGQLRYAAQAAMNHKKIPLLHEVRSVVSDPSILAFIDNYLAQNEKK